MAEEKKLIVPQSGELWIKKRYYGDRSKADPLQGWIYPDPETGELMFLETHFGPEPVAERKLPMVHGENNWFRVLPPVAK